MTARWEEMTGALRAGHAGGRMGSDWFKPWIGIIGL
jgi:hypothetical protein